MFFIIKIIKILSNIIKTLHNIIKSWMILPNPVKCWKILSCIIMVKWDIWESFLASPQSCRLLSKIRTVLAKSCLVLSKYYQVLLKSCVVLSKSCLNLSNTLYYIIIISSYAMRILHCFNTTLCDSIKIIQPINTIL